MEECDRSGIRNCRRKNAIKLVGSNHTKISSNSSANAIAVDLYEKWQQGDAIPEGKSAGEDKDSLIGGNILYATFVVDGSVAGNALTLSFGTVYSAVQGGADVEDDQTFTNVKPTITATLGTYTAESPDAQTGGFAALTEAQ